MTLSEKVAYLKGVAEGLKFDPDKTTEGKLISIMMDILEHLSLNTEEDDDSIQALADQLDDVSDSLAMLEDYVYSEEFPDIEDEYDDEESDDSSNTDSSTDSTDNGDSSYENGDSDDSSGGDDGGDDGSSGGDDGGNIAPAPDPEPAPDPAEEDPES